MEQSCSLTRSFSHCQPVTRGVTVRQLFCFDLFITSSGITVSPPRTLTKWVKAEGPGRKDPTRREFYSLPAFATASEKGGGHRRKSYRAEKFVTPKTRRPSG